MAQPYLIKHAPARAQYRLPRRATPSGLIVVHTAESVMDTIGPDTGAENVADFICRRSDPGSYHQLADSDSHVHLVPYDAEAYGDGTGSNLFAIHISFACRAADWPLMSAARRAGFLAQGAKATVDAMTWLRANRHPVPPLERISRAASERREPGFISHGARDPGRRSDPGSDFPWAAYFTAIRNELEDDMSYSKWPKADREALVADVAKAILGKEQGNGNTVQNNIRRAGDTRALAVEIAKELKRLS